MVLGIGRFIHQRDGRPILHDQTIYHKNLQRVVFVYGERTKYVTSDQMAEMDYSGMQYGQAPTMRAFKGEEQFTSAILSLVAPDVPTVTSNAALVAARIELSNRNHSSS